MALTDNLNLWLNHDEASGNRLDSSGNSRTFTNNNSVGTTTGVISAASSFTAASSQYLSRASETGLQTGAANWVVCFFFKITTFAAGAVLVSKRATAGSTREFEISQRTGNLIQFETFNGAGTTRSLAITPSSVSTGTWYWLYAQHDQDTGKTAIALDNAALTEASDTGALGTNSTAWGIGGNGDGGAYSSVAIDLLGFWKGRVLTSDERTQLYNSGAGYDPFAVGHPARKRMGGVQFGQNTYRQFAGVRGW